MGWKFEPQILMYLTLNILNHRIIPLFAWSHHVQYKEVWLYWPQYLTEPASIIIFSPHVHAVTEDRVGMGIHFLLFIEKGDLPIRRTLVIMCGPTSCSVSTTVYKRWRCTYPHWMVVGWTGCYVCTGAACDVGEVYCWQLLGSSSRNSSTQSALPENTQTLIISYRTTEPRLELASLVILCQLSVDKAK